MKCAYCGAEVRAGAKFCTECGKPLPASAPPRPATRAKRRWLWSLLAIPPVILVLCVCVIGVVYFALSSGILPISISSTADEKVAEQIGPSGGEIAGPGGIKVVVPEGVLDREVEISISEVSVPPTLPASYLMSTAGPAYEITAPEGTEFHGVVDVLLPLDRQEEADEDLYTVLYWDGSAWWDIGGFVEGDFIRTRVEHFSILRPALGYSLRRPVGFRNHGPYNATVRPWTYIPLWADTPAPPPRASTTTSSPDSPGLWPNPARFLDLPMGTYTFCIDWTDGQDLDEDGYFDYYYYVDDRPVTLDENDSLETDLAEEVDVSTDSGQPGRCPLAPLVAEAEAGAEGAATPAPGVGDVTVRLSWRTTDDLDLHVTDPYGEEIYYGNRQAASGGELDRDSNAACFEAASSPVENIFWPTDGAPLGQYTVRVHYFADCDDVAPVQFRLRIMVDGRVAYDSTGSLSGDEDSFTYDFTH